MEKKFTHTLNVPKVWKSLLDIESFDDLSAFLESEPPPQALEPNGLTRADWSRPIRHDRRKVSFEEEGHKVCLELISGDDKYFAVPSLELPNGERYAPTDVEFDVSAEEILEIRGIARFVWKQQLV